MVAFVYVGVCLSIAGPALAHLRERSGVGIGVSGLLIGGQSLGYIIGSLVAGRFYDHGHGHEVMVRAGAAGTLAIAALTVVDQFWAMVALFILIGMAGAAMDVGGNTLVVWSRPPERVGASLNALHLCFGIGALATPIAVAASIDVLGSLGLIAVSTAVVLVVVTWRLHGTQVPVRRRATHHDLDAASSARALAIVCVFFVFYVGAEITLAGWLHTYGEQIGLGDEEAASLLVSTFWAGFVTGRVVAVRIARRMASSTMLVGSCVLSTISTVALGLGDGSATVVWVLTAATGCFLGPQFATMMAYGDERLRLSGASTSRFVAAAGLGGLVIPVVAGWQLESRGADALPWTVAAACAASLLLAIALVSVGRQPATTAR